MENKSVNFSKVFTVVTYVYISIFLISSLIMVLYLLCGGNINFPHFQSRYEKQVIESTEQYKGGGYGK